MAEIDIKFSSGSPAYWRKLERETTKKILKEDKEVKELLAKSSPEEKREIEKSIESQVKDGMQKQKKMLENSFNKMLKPFKK